MKKKPTLLVLAAGMGSRYGSLKQIDPVGPSGETIIDYSIFDAIRAGFGKIVFIIRKSFEQDFKDVFVKKLEGKIAVEYVFQELENLPKGFKLPADRTKPWGTGHAVLMAKEVVKEPFAVINGDDFYGFEAFESMSKYLQSLTTAKQNQFALMGYLLGNTLSENGSVSRGVCVTDRYNFLRSVTERTDIRYSPNGVVFTDYDGSTVLIQPDTLVSMNFWGFTPEYFKLTEPLFAEFLKNHINEAKSEFYIPSAIDKLINQKTARVKALSSNARWFGVTYKEDKPLVIEKLAQLCKAGVYPTRLWN